MSKPYEITIYCKFRKHLVTYLVDRCSGGGRHDWEWPKHLRSKTAKAKRWKYDMTCKKCGKPLGATITLKVSKWREEDDQTHYGYSNLVADVISDHYRGRQANEQ